MRCTDRYYVIILLVLAVTEGLTDSVFDVCDNIQLCGTDEYLKVSGFVDDDCTVVCDIFGSGSSGNGNEYNCHSCHSLCTTCYGRNNDQCYSCEDYYMTIDQGNEIAMDSFICTNGIVRNTSLDVVMCLSKCPNGFIPNDDMECVCPAGQYLNGTMCSECSRFCSSCVNGTQIGCLSCSIVEYNGQCMEECPLGTVNINRICTNGDQRELFPIDMITLFSIIGAVGFMIFFCFAWICCIIYCFIYNEKRRKNKNKYLLSTEGATSISESFKKVARNISIKRRPPRPISSVNPVNSEHYIEPRSYDPYLDMNDVSDEHLINSQVSTVKFELTARQQSTEDEELYMQMTPATSVDNINNEGRVVKNEHKKLSLTNSYNPPSNTSQVNISKRTSMPAVEYFEEEDLYVNENDLGHGGSQENYVVMDINGNNEQDEYVVPSDLVIGNSQSMHTGQEEDEQELYMDMDTRPPVPRKGVLPATRQQDKTQRKDTLDNEYVKITGNDKKLTKNFLSDEQLAPKYVNVQRSGDPRLRSVTSPPLSVIKPVKPDSDTTEQPIYQTFDEEGDGEDYYGVVN